MEEESAPPQEACGLIEFMKQWMEQIDAGHPSNGTTILEELCLPSRSPSSTLIFLYSFQLLSCLFLSSIPLPSP